MRRKRVYSNRRRLTIPRAANWNRAGSGDAHPELPEEVAAGLDARRRRGRLGWKPETACGSTAQ